MITTIKALKDLGSAYFRIDWIGDVMPRSLLAATTPSVNIVVSVRHSLDEVRLDEERIQHELFIPVAFLRLLRVGDFWHNGQLIKASDGEKLVFPDLEINETTVEVKPVGMPVTIDEESRYLLPFDRCCTHRRHTGSYAARIKLNERTYLLIPCMELIRFYFGASGALLSRLFSGPIQGEQLCTSARISPLGRAHIKLAERLPGIAAPTVARIALDSDAANAAKWIIKSGVAASANKTRNYPAMKFPFVGRTTLNLVGRWVRTPDFNVCVVDRLVSCTHPFPFRSLFYELHPGTKIKEPKKSLSLEKNPFRQKIRSKNNSSDHVELNQGSVVSSLTVLTVGIGEPDAFPDLKEKPIRRIASKSPGVSAGAMKSMPLAVGPPECKGVHRGVDLSATLVSSDLSPPEAILEAVNILKTEHDINIELVPLPNLLPGKLTPFKQIKYVKPTNQKTYPVILGAQMFFHNNGQRKEFFLLTFESLSHQTEWVTAIFSRISDDRMLGATKDNGLLLLLWRMGRYLAGFEEVTRDNQILTKKFVSVKHALDPQKLAQSILESS